MGAPAPKKAQKSGLKTLKASEVLFNENDVAGSLYIIQKGQIRLFRPKGKGFIELAILRAGEVIGEMAYFDEKSRRRSCSASAIVQTDVIEISFNAFGKTMAGLNPWFKTIINTLADRLRKTNERVKELESNSVSYGRGGKVSDYKFFHSIDVIRVLSVIYLCLKAHGEEKNGKTSVHMNRLKIYLIDIFNVQEIKFEELMQILVEEKYVELDLDQDNLPKLVTVANVERLRGISAFLDNQRRVDDAKKLKISNKCERFLKRIIDQVVIKGFQGPSVEVDISSILLDFKERNVPIVDSDLKDAVDAGLCDDIIVGSANKLFSKVNADKLMKIFPAIKLMNAIEKVNEEKAGKTY